MNGLKDANTRTSGLVTTLSDGWLDVSVCAKTLAFVFLVGLLAYSMAV